MRTVRSSGEAPLPAAASSPRIGVRLSMYVCICNGLTERRVREAAAGARSVSGVYRALGTRPQCGKCVDCVRAMLPGCGGAGAEAANAAVPASIRA
ncbi:(2Fe-2S)-binding protein [Tistrella mobilis]|uniref:(2Fe-2S)-binding protein n=2 Tax=Tistrella mobilis TaxID=171437 RepID=UPI0035574DB4